LLIVLYGSEREENERKIKEKVVSFFSSFLWCWDQEKKTTEMRAVIACLALTALTLLAVSAHVHDEDDVVIVPVGVPVCVFFLSCSSKTNQQKAPNVLEPKATHFKRREGWTRI